MIRAHQIDSHIYEAFLRKAKQVTLSIALTATDSAGNSAKTTASAKLR